MPSCTKQHRWVVASQSYYEQWTRGAYETGGSGREPRMHTWWTARCPVRAPFIAARARETKSNTKSSQFKSSQKSEASQCTTCGSKQGEAAAHKQDRNQQQQHAPSSRTYQGTYQEGERREDKKQATQGHRKRRREHAAAPNNFSSSAHEA